MQTDYSKKDLEHVLSAMVSAVESDTYENRVTLLPPPPSEIYIEGPFSRLLNNTFDSIQVLTQVVETIAENNCVNLAQSFRKFPNKRKEGIYRGFFYCRGRRNHCPFKVRFTWKSKLEKYEIVEVRDTHIHKNLKKTGVARSTRRNGGVQYPKPSSLYINNLNGDTYLDERGTTQRYLKMKQICDVLIERSMENESYFKKLYPLLLPFCNFSTVIAKPTNISTQNQNISIPSLLDDSSTTKLQEIISEVPLPTINSSSDTTEDELEEDFGAPLSKKAKF